MRKGGGRAKGNGFEREIALQIIETFAACGICKDDCYRTPGSGGHRFAKKVDPGDLVISPKLRKYWPFAVECKFYARISMDLLLVPNVKEGLFRDWWVQATASAGKRVPLLIFRQNRQQAYAMFPYGGAVRNSVSSLFDDHGFMELEPSIHTRVNGEHVFVVRFKSLLRHFRRLHARRKGRVNGREVLRPALDKQD